MNISFKTMDGLVGASSSLKIVRTPFKVYKEAEARGDKEVMERSMGYVQKFEAKAHDYRSQAREGTQEDAEEGRDVEKLRREESIEKTRAENRAKREKSLENASDDGENAENAVPDAEKTDLSDIEFQPVTYDGEGNVKTETAVSAESETAFYAEA